ncbi:Cyclic di-GMP phosphodiesterase Gmr [Tritonibacter multivorans]|uniref:Cyclic di-GMP phosphodiesterase Gmr n=1 Tax=Tritonibacter multivorans TaxID=928856 RepID=A0A0P1G2F6_9RHOB|nr:EAL domain-containing protein [Tritonibacter multivorans]MDA7419700.1 EAL domain-containing protein [Tritonibacter multivorans]CUH76005.1 Cyclic di-GMP phosphodiesterase Gmr [Tritonibacter multivorans]SFC57159.1 diguanylate phosphodiesterase [Tritonibacter multivorans]
MKKRHFWKTDIPEGGENPLNAAVVARDRSTVDMVAEAVKHDQTLLAFQPIVQAANPGMIAFFEGYIRVMDATGRIIPARDFMPVIEERELGRKLDALALEQGLKTLSRNPNIRLSINMSARSIGYSQWMRVLETYLKRDEFLGERLVLEIAEASAMAAPELVIDFMDQMQQHGIAFALDNFGAGTTAIGHFREFFFDAVKIDGQFVRGVHANHDNQSVVRSLIAIAKQFDMFVVAESVEREEDAAFLIDAGADCLQGFLYGAPTINPPWEARNEQKRA